MFGGTDVVGLAQLLMPRMSIAGKSLTKRRDSGSSFCVCLG